MTPPDTSTLPFADHARKIVRLLRAAFAELLIDVGADPTNHQSITAAIGLNKNLAWRLTKIVQADDPDAVLQHMPGNSGLKIFLKACRTANADAAALADAEKAIAAYEEFIRVHSGDRATAQIMTSALSPRGRATSDEQHRKMLFQGASYVWGAQARTQLKLGVFGPGAEDGLADFASLNALIDFRRLRADVPWVMAARSSSNDDGSAMRSFSTEAIDERYAGDTDVPLMEDFCSKPIPEFRRYSDAGFSSFELIEGPVGNRGAQTCVFGSIHRNIPYYRTPENEWGRHNARCDTPVEQMIVDLYLHRSFTFALPPEVLLVSQMGTSPPAPRSRIQQLPLREKLQDLGEDALPVVTPDVRRYNMMAHAVFERCGWDPAEFHGYRMTIAYPPCPTLLALRYRLPEREPKTS